MRALPVKSCLILLLPALFCAGAAQAQLPRYPQPGLIPPEQIGAYVMWQPGVGAQDVGAVMNSARSTGAEVLHSIGVRGQGVAAAVLDTPFDVEHPYIQPNILDASALFSPKNLPYASDGSMNKNWTFEGKDLVYKTGKDAPRIVAGNMNPNDPPTHGTHVAGTVHGMAPDAGLILLSAAAGTYGRDGFDELNDDALASALRYLSMIARQYGVAAVNNSWGTAPNADWTLEAQAEDERVYTMLSSELWAAGIAPVFASGNAGSNNVVDAPANYAGAVAVGALNPHGFIAEFSNQSAKVVLLAPGVDIYSSVPLFDSQNAVAGHVYENFPGTSMATPHVTGAITLLKSGAPYATAAEIVRALETTGDTVHYDPNLPLALSIMPGIIQILYSRFTDPTAPQLTAKCFRELKKAGLFPAGDFANLADASVIPLETAREMQRTYDRIVAAATAVGGGNINSFNPDNPVQLQDFLAAYRARLDSDIDQLMRSPLETTTYKYIRVDKALPYLMGAEADRQATTLPGRVASAMALAWAEDLRQGALTSEGWRQIAQLAYADVKARQKAYRQMSPAWTASAVEGQQLSLRAMSERLGERKNAPLWAEVLGSYSERDGTHNASSYHAKLGGLLVGAERQSGQTHYGLFGLLAEQQQNGSDGKASARLLGAGIYGGSQRDQTFIHGEASYIHAKTDLTRKTTLPGVCVPIAPGLIPFYGAPCRTDLANDLSYRAQARQTTHNLNVRLTFGHDFLQRADWSLGLRVEGGGIFSYSEGYRERDAGSLDLQVDRFKSRYLEGGAGLAWTKWSAEPNGLSASAKLMLLHGKASGDAIHGHWRHSGAPFDIKPERLAQTSLAPTLAVRWSLGNAWLMQVGYAGRYGREVETHAFQAAVWRNF